MQGALNAAIDAVDGLCGPTDPVAITEVIQGCTTFVLTTTPVLSLTSVTGERYGSIDLSGLRFDGASGVVRTTYGVPVMRDDWYEVAYQAGRATVPPAIIEGTKIILKHQWATRQGPARRPGSATDDVSTAPGMAYAIPNRALQILDRYLLGPSVA